MRLLPCHAYPCPVLASSTCGGFPGGRLSRNDRSVRAKIAYRSQSISFTVTTLLVTTARHLPSFPPSFPPSFSDVLDTVRRRDPIRIPSHASRARRTAVVRSITAQLRYLRTRREPILNTSPYTVRTRFSHYTRCRRNSLRATSVCEGRKRRGADGQRKERWRTSIPRASIR
uniref:Uncharacterized protein n=1 Tax=Sipha flava TaxID=143950 RepID=A0A2S2QS02_9HEMI